MEFLLSFLGCSLVGQASELRCRSDACTANGRETKPSFVPGHDGSKAEAPRQVGQQLNGVQGGLPSSTNFRQQLLSRGSNGSPSLLAGKQPLELLGKASRRCAAMSNFCKAATEDDSRPPGKPATAMQGSERQQLGECYNSSATGVDCGLLPGFAVVEQQPRGGTHAPATFDGKR